MKKKRVWRYYCEYCKKSGCSAYHMKNHEVSCTMNPNRKCRMCGYTEGHRNSMDELVAIVKKAEPDMLTQLREATGGCPMCMLAAIRQSGVQYYEIDEDGVHSNFISEFDFKKEKEQFWRDSNDARAQESYDYGYGY
uniref:Uncharacterized protein n=1 Tax=viral metagenome TaxID=1070528 RepID=A0A6M3J3H1_9ZZZZ